MDPVLAQLVSYIKQNGLPMPSGTTENGEPYWLVGERTVRWAEMQQIVAQVQQQTAASGGKIEQAPVIPATPNLPEVKLEAKPEQESIPSPENRAENRVEQAAEKGADSSTSSANGNKQGGQAKAKTSHQKHKGTYVGDSPKLAVDLDDPQDMLDFYRQNKEGKGDPKSSDTFLAMLFGKILRSFFPTTS